MIKMNTLKQLTVTAALFALGACVNPIDESNGNPNANTDIDNKTVVTEMGSMAYTGLDESAGLGGAFSSLNSIPKLSESAGLQKSSDNSLAKDAAEPDPAYTIDSTEKDNGYILVIGTVQTLLYTKTDSIWVKWDERAQDDIEDNENIMRLVSVKKFIGGRIEKAEITDLDGDGVVNGEEQYASEARLETYVKYATGVEEFTTIDVTSGEDKDFDTEDDNQIIDLAYEKKKDGKILNSAELTDADGDGFIVSKDPDVPSIVDAVLFETDNPWKPLVASSRLEMTLEVTDDTEDGTIVSISGEETLKNGRVNKIQVLDMEGNIATVEPNDKVQVVVTSDFPVTEDSLLSSEVKFIINVGSGLNDSSDNLLYEAHVVHEKRFGAVKKAEFHFVAKDPVPEGEDPNNGSVDIKIIFRNDKTATLTGTFDEGELEATLTGPEGNTLTLIWNEAGELVEEEEI